MLRLSLPLLCLVLAPLHAQEDLYKDDLDAAVEALRKGKLTRAESLFQQVLEGLDEPEAADRPDAATVYVCKAGLLQLLRIRGDFSGVVKGVEAMPGVDARRREMRLLLADVRLRTGEYEKAEAELAQLVAADPNDIEARYRLGTVLQAMGRRNDARAAFTAAVAEAAKRPPTDALAMTSLARCHLAIGGRSDLEIASELAVAASELDPELPDPRIVLGRLKFLAYGEAKGYPSGERDLLAVLDANGEVEEALLALYELRSANAILDPSKTEQFLDRVLALNPQSVPALVERASTLLGDRRFEDGARQLDDALAIDPRHRRALAYRSAAAFLLNRPTEEREFRKRLESGDGEGAEPERIHGELLSTLYRFADAAPYFERALERDPEDVDAMQGLARVRIYTGRGEEAVPLLTKAKQVHSGRVDPWRNNALAVEELLRDEYETVEAGSFRFVVHRDDLEVLRAYVFPLHEEALKTLGARYRHMPESPVRVEILHTWTDFSVRTVGFRGFLALGACFGNLITLVSPGDARLRRQDFMWSATVWHEYAHVLTLALSRSRIPRWLTEGISVYEERQRNPAWERGMDRELLDAWHNGEIVPLRMMNSLFRGPRILFGYFLGGVVVDKLAREHGFDKVVELVKAFGEDRPAEVAFREIFGESTREFDQRLLKEVAEVRLAGLKLIPRSNDATISRLLDRIAKDGGDLAARVQVGFEFARRGNVVDAADQVRGILSREPGNGPGLLLQADLLRRRDAVDAAIDGYRKGFAAGADDFDARMHLGQLLQKNGDVDGAIEQFRAAKLCWPGCTEQAEAPEIALYKLLRANDRIDEAMVELRSYVAKTGRAFQPRLDLAAFAKRAGDRKLEAHYLMEAVQIDPFMRDLHVRLADAYEALGLKGEAAVELAVAIAIRPALDRASIGRPRAEIPAEDAESERLTRAELSVRRAKLLRSLRRDVEAFAALKRALDEVPTGAIADEAKALRDEWGR